MLEISRQKMALGKIFIGLRNEYGTIWRVFRTVLSSIVRVVDVEKGQASVSGKGMNQVRCMFG